MEFHISRAVRTRHQIDDTLFSLTGNVVFANLAQARALAARINQPRAAAASLPEPQSRTQINPAALFAMGLIDELSHALIAHYRHSLDPAVLAHALTFLSTQLPAAPENSTEALLLTFTDLFPNTAVFRNQQTAADWLAASTATTEALQPSPNREAALEELLLLHLANTNPAFAPFRELFDDTPLQRQTAYTAALTALPEFFATRPPLPTGQTLLDALRAPMLAAPNSLTGQLTYIQQHWPALLGDRIRRILLLATDVLSEEELAIWRIFHPPTEEDLRQAAMRAAAEAAQAAAGRYNLPGGRPFYDGPPTYPSPTAPLEYEAFSPDEDWMPSVVLLAKSTYVWLEQLSRKYSRHIHRLDQIPDEELDLIRSRGLNGLWLIGIWERSVASKTIKNLRGQTDAVASAYSLRDYRIAQDLGGDPAYQSLRDRSAARGIRLASDMVPNHMGIDSTWSIEHPEWFLSRPDSPYPAYTFNGPNLSPDPRVEIKIEDHYFSQTDAAVVFLRRDTATGDTRFVYHGNDGTSFPWNDTAQLDYSSAAAREQVIRTILAVARQFPIIRFDAAMTLAKKHVQRLWFPLLGSGGGAIPSRAESSMSEADFDHLMPHEFWREVVDRVAAEVPGTLLLAEAFWLLEGYFVRTLGMHRVYNSAFMNMLRDEENAKYRSVIKNTVEFDPDILKRYVNFMSNPDERTAIDQFGTGDKYFGVATLMATLPGLPMFGHGQIEAFTEKYGMEYKKARFEEWPNEDLIARHNREIAPLLRNRKLFAESTNFVLYDLWRDDGTVDENVFAYSNRSVYGNPEGRALVLFHNHFGDTRGTIHRSVSSFDKASGAPVQRTLTEALGLSVSPDLYFGWRDSATSLEYLRPSTDLAHNGFSIDLRAYQYAVLGNWRELRPSATEPWDQLALALNGAGVHSLDDSLAKLRFRPVHEALRRVLSPELLTALNTIATTSPSTVAALDAGPNPQTVAAELQSVAADLQPTDPNLQLETSGPDALSILDPEFARTSDSQLAASFDPAANVHSPALSRFARHAAEIFAAIEQTGLLPASRPPELTPQNFAAQAQSALQSLTQLPALEARFGTPWPPQARLVLPSTTPGPRPNSTWAPALAWSVLSGLADTPSARTELFDRLHLRSALAEIFLSLGLEGEDTWRAAARTRLLLALPDPTPNRIPISDPSLWSDPDLRWLGGVNTSGDATWFNQEAFTELLWWTSLPALLQQTSAPKPAPKPALGSIEETIRHTVLKAEAAGFRLDTYLAGPIPQTRAAPSPQTPTSVVVYTQSRPPAFPDEPASPAPTAPLSSARTPLHPKPPRSPQAPSKQSGKRPSAKSSPKPTLPPADTHIRAKSSPAKAAAKSKKPTVAQQIPEIVAKAVADDHAKAIQAASKPAPNAPGSKPARASTPAKPAAPAKPVAAKPAASAKAPAKRPEKP